MKITRAWFVSQYLCILMIYLEGHLTTINVRTVKAMSFQEKSREPVLRLPLQFCSSDAFHLQDSLAISIHPSSRPPSHHSLHHCSSS
jgi:hypothetical protein